MYSKWRFLWSLDFFVGNGWVLIALMDSLFFSTSSNLSTPLLYWKPVHSLLLHPVSLQQQSTFLQDCSDLISKQGPLHHEESNPELLNQPSWAILISHCSIALASPFTLFALNSVLDFLDQSSMFNLCLGNKVSYFAQPNSTMFKKTKNNRKGTCVGLIPLSLYL